MEWHVIRQMASWVLLSAPDQVLHTSLCMARLSQQAMTVLVAACAWAEAAACLELLEVWMIVRDLTAAKQ